MRVLLVLADAAGQVITRDELFNTAWGGDIVGDDSLNRVINRVRRIDTETGPGEFSIETVPRTGYRLTGNFPSSSGSVGRTGIGSPVSRRAMIAGGVTAAAGVAGLGTWSARSQSDKEFNALLLRGGEVLDYSDPAIDAEPYFRKALALRPHDARALGLEAYALSLRTERPDSAQTGDALQRASATAGRALSLDPAQPDARLALLLSHQSSLDLTGTEEGLRSILEWAPANINAMRNLWNMLQCVGRSREALALVNRSLAIAPFAAGSHYPKAQLLWITGKTAEADRVVDKALQYWPSHRFVRFARFTILSFTGRALAALAMLEKEETRPQAFSPESLALWRTTLRAIDGGTSAQFNAARTANLSQALSNLSLCRQAAISLCVLGDVDAAFKVANALFAVSRDRLTAPKSSVSSAAWRFAPWIFIPPTAPMRADPRFDALCESIGLADYWEKRGVRPDFRSPPA